MKTIINWIDATKAISIMAVFFVHSQLYYGCWLDKVNDFIHPFYVNSFFFVSGYLLFRKQLSSPIIEEGVLQYVIGEGTEKVPFFYDQNGKCLRFVTSLSANRLK